MNRLHASVRTRTKQLPGLVGNGYALGGGQFGQDVPFLGELDIDEKEMSVVVPFADGQRRDGVGDLLEIGGIDLSRHSQNPIVLFDHAKSNPLPIAKAEHPESKAYLVTIDPVNKLATGKAYFYRGKGMNGVSKEAEYNHAVFCEQLFDMVKNRFVRGGSIGYQVKNATNLRADYEAGTPAGLHLHNVLMLEFSIVVLPANGDTVRKGFATVQAYDEWADGLRHKLSFKSLCGKPIDGYLMKSLTAWLPEQTKVVSGYEGKSVSPEHADACAAQGKPTGVTALGYGCGDHKSTSADLEREANACSGADTSQYACGKVDKSIRTRTKGVTMPSGQSAGMPIKNAATAQRLANMTREFTNSYPSSPDDAQEMAALAMMKQDTKAWSDAARAASIAARRAEAKIRVNASKSSQSKRALAASSRAEEDNPASHESAAKEHDKASAHHTSMGYGDVAAAHQQMAEFHREVAKPSSDAKSLPAAHKSIRTKRKGYNPQSQMDGNPLNNTSGVDSAMNTYMAKVRRADAAGKENGGNAIQNRRAAKSISVNYKNKLVRGFTNVNMKFNLKDSAKDKQAAFLQEMHEAGMGSPQQGRWSPGTDLGKPLRIATYNVDITPDKSLDDDGNEAMASIIGKAAGIARKHGIRFIGNVGKPEPTDGSTHKEAEMEPAAEPVHDRSVRNRSAEKALARSFREQEVQIKRLLDVVQKFNGVN